MSKKVKKAKFDLPFVFSLSIVGIFVLFLLAIVVIFAKPKFFCANSISCVNDLSGKKEVSNEGSFMGKIVYAPPLPNKADLEENKPTEVLGDQAGDYKHIYVDLTNQRLYAFEGNAIIMNVPVSTGKWGPTPTGDFRIWIWLRYTRMTGGSGTDYYNLPNVPYTMYFYNNSTPKSWGYSLHGAYWHNNFGHPMSHGCVNMRIEDAQKIFYWTNAKAGNVSYPTADIPGTLITIYGTAPKE